MTQHSLLIFQLLTKQKQPRCEDSFSAQLQSLLKSSPHVSQCFLWSVQGKCEHTPVMYIDIFVGKWLKNQTPSLFTTITVITKKNLSKSTPCWAVWVVSCTESRLCKIMIITWRPSFWDTHLPVIRVDLETSAAHRKTSFSAHFSNSKSNTDKPKMRHYLKRK